MKYLLVSNKIRRITSSEVEFDNPEAGKGAYTVLRRIHGRQTIWKLLKEGVCVHREYIRAYKLTLA